MSLADHDTANELGVILGRLGGEFKGWWDEWEGARGQGVKYLVLSARVSQLLCVLGRRCGEGLRDWGRQSCAASRCDVTVTVAEVILMDAISTLSPFPTRH